MPLDSSVATDRANCAELGKERSTLTSPNLRFQDDQSGQYQQRQYHEPPHKSASNHDDPRVTRWPSALVQPRHPAHTYPDMTHPHPDSKSNRPPVVMTRCQESCRLALNASVHYCNRSNNSTPTSSYDSTRQAVYDK